MYCAYQDREELEDELYQEDDRHSEVSEVNSELEFQLYSQLHYSSNAGDMEEQVDGGEEAEDAEVTEKSADVDGEREHAGDSRPQSPDASKLEQYLKKKKKKREQCDKSNPRSQRSSSSVFEEVIVIDSSPNVITISEGDTADDDEGVCAIKGRGSQQLQTSTPAPQGTQKRKSVPLVTLDSSSSESDSYSESESDSSESSESSDSSDSDGLENWMILGRGNQDGDQSISLNLEGGSNRYTDVEEDFEEQAGSWLVSDKDKEAGIYNKDKGARIAVQRVPNRYYTSKSVQCRNCNKNGHLSKNCPEPKKLSSCFLCGTPGHVVSQCPNRHCSNCGLPGHFHDACNERAYWHKQCHRCSMRGHFFDACPEIWRQYHITTKAGIPVKQQGEDNGRSPAYCYNCSRKGHFGHACTWQRMFNGTYPTTPFINHYDTVDDINRRQHRIKMKVKDLKRSGLFPDCPQTPLTPGPPKKRQKIVHHKNSHQPNHTPHQSPHNHKPSSSHIFFNDSDFTAPAPKTHRYNKSKQQESASNVKPWKPKRPVPTTRPTPTKLVLDEADDFPRGGGKGESVEMMRKKKRMMMKKKKQVPSEGHRNGPESKAEKAKRKRSQHWKGAAKKRDAQMYPTDENLFIIKQRKRRR